MNDGDRHNVSPPRLATRFLRGYCHPELVDEVEGDLYELFQRRTERQGLWRAKLLYWLNVLMFLHPDYIERRKKTYPVNHTAMFRNYFKISFRNIIRNKAFSVINIVGLALGMTCFLFIFLWVQDERSIDNFHTNENLYNVYQTTYAHEEVDGRYTTPVRFTDDRRHILLEGIQESIPEIEHVNFYATGYELPWGHPEIFQVGEEIHKLEGSRAGADFFTMFNYPLIAGGKENALKDINSIAISRKMAALFFESPEEAIGKSIRYENQFDFTITAVFEDITSKSSLQFDFLLNWEFHNKRSDGWASHVVLTTVQLAENADVEQVESTINRSIQTYLDQDESIKIEVGLQPFKDKYLVSNFENGKPSGGRIEYIRLFISVAIFILIIACINFMNLSTARATKRAKEVGVRKVVGSSRKHLVGQFLGESISLAFLSLLLSLLLIQVFLPSFNQFTGKQVDLSLSEPAYWVVLLGLMLVTGFFAGSYPALYLASLRPVQVLKGDVRFTRSATWFRKGLVVFQFSLSTLLLIGTLVVTQQTNYIQNSHLGYDRENLIYVRTEGELTKQPKYNIFKNKASELPGVALVDRSTAVPHAMEFEVADPISWEGKQEGDVVNFKPFSVGFDFPKIMRLELAEGRGFSRQVATDSTEAFLVNEAAVKQMGMKDPIGKWVSAWDKKGRIIGVLRDYHTHSFHEPIKPIIMDVKEYEYFGVVLIRTEPGKTKEALTGLEKIYKDINPNYPFDYQFLDQEYAKLYRSEQVIAKLSNVFALLAIVVSCLGLLGLAMFSSEQRIKEIGIRKVLGATESSIVRLLSQDFLGLVLVAFVIATPVAWYTLSRWLEGFAYRVAMPWWVFALAGSLALLIALVTVSFQSIKAALANPVDSLRNE